MIVEENRFDETFNYWLHWMWIVAGIAGWFAPARTELQQLLFSRFSALKETYCGHLSFHLMSHGSGGGQVAEDLSYRKLECFAGLFLLQSLFKIKCF